MELDIDIGADAKDWAAISANEKLKPVEAELRRVEEAITEVVSEMEYLRQREQMLRDTNESTNNRVKYFGIGTTWLLVGLWAWQIMYLRSYFRYVLCRGGNEYGDGVLTNGLLGLSISSERGGRRGLGLGDWAWNHRISVLMTLMVGFGRGSVQAVDYGRQIRQSFSVLVYGDGSTLLLWCMVWRCSICGSNLHRRGRFSAFNSYAPTRYEPTPWLFPRQNP